MSKFASVIRRNKLIDTLFVLRGNARTCVYLEPLWGVPNNLFMPLSAVYMVALGLSQVQIGLVASIYLLSQMFASLISGAATDRLGRRVTVMLFDILGWIIPFILWMNARGFAWFAVAAAFNGFWRAAETSFGLLMVEDTPHHQLVSIYALTSIAGLLAGFVSPLTSVLVSNFSLIVTMRGLYVFALLCMIVLIVIRHFNTQETSVGKKRREELAGKPFFTSMRGSGRVLRQMFSNKPLMMVLGMMSCVMVIRSALENFWPLLLTGRLGISPAALPLLSALRSLGMLACFFLLAPRLSPQRFFKPILLGLSLLAVLHLALFVLPPGLSFMVFPGVLAEALAFSMMIPLFSSLQMLLLEKTERARMFGFSLALCLLVTSPFGALNGLLSRLYLPLPMLLSMLLAILATVFLGKLNHEMAGRSLFEAEG